MTYNETGYQALYNPTLEFLALDPEWRRIDCLFQDLHGDWTTLECGIVASLILWQRIPRYDAEVSFLCKKMAGVP